MIPGPFIDDLDQRMAALGAALVAAMPDRHVFVDTLQPFTDYSDAQLTTGVVQLVQDREQDYHNGIGMEGRLGTLRTLVYARLRVADNAERATLAAAERELAAAVKTWCRTGVTGLRLRLESIQFSRGLDFPYGWLAAYVAAGPQRDNVTP